ncbi:MAG: methyltransferase domain-containing protein [Phycisphaerales bacterium]
MSSVSKSSMQPGPASAPPPGCDSAEQWLAHEESRRQRAVRAGVLADAVLSCCGVGSVLEVGCGGGALLRELAARGCDARGIDVSEEAVRGAARWQYPRVAVGDVRALQEEGAVDTVVAVDVLHFLEEHEVPGALGAIARATRGAVFLRVSTLPVDERPQHRTARGREWWQQRCFEAGLRTHPRALLAAPYDQMDSQVDSVTLVLEKLPEAAGRWPLARLAEEKQLHMDMLREPGRRADAHVARYALAAGLVRPGDRVLDVACGLGYGSHVIAHNSRAGSVLGVDLDAGSVAYASALHGGTGRVSFQAGDAQDLAGVPDASVDLVVSFETLEHLPDPGRALRAFARVLTPGGRLVASVPNDWTDGEGKDPNPHHLHVYTWPALASQVLGAGLLPECAHAQTAGGGMKLPGAARAVRAVPVTEQGALLATDVAAEWWLVTAMKDPLASGGKEGYRETVFPVREQYSGNVAAFGRDYDNPWLVRSMVSIGQRATGRLLFSLASRAVDQCRDGSPDQGAALCVLAYQALESVECESGWVLEYGERVRAYDACADASPHGQRWRCSNWFVLGRLMQRLGDNGRAAGAFLACVGVHTRAFSPLLATKTVEARWWLGVLAAGAGDLPAARSHWQAGVQEAHLAAAADWRDVVGDPERPFAFGLPELSQVLDQAARCAWALGLGDAWGRVPGLAWGASATNATAQRVSVAREAAQLRGAWAGQQRAIAELIRTRDSLWEESRRTVGELVRTKEEAERVHEAWRGREAQVAALEAEKARLWEGQRESLAAMEAEQARVVAERDRVYAESQRLAALWEDLRAHNEELQRAVEAERSLRAAAESARDENWQESRRVAGLWEQMRQDNARFMEDNAGLAAQVAGLSEARGLLEQKLADSAADRARVGEELSVLRERVAGLERSLQALRSQLDTYRAGLRYRLLRAARLLYELP